MEPFDPRLLPFVTRNALSFQGGNTFSLIADVIGTSANPIEIRGFTKDGHFTNKIEPTAGGNIQTYSFPLTDIPIAVSVFISTDGDPNIVQYVTLHLGVGDNRIALLCQGSISPIYGISWPHQHPLTPDQALGDYAVITGLTPGVGNEIYDSVPAFQSWELLGIHLKLTASAQAADRTVILQLESGYGMVWRRAAGATQQANEAQDYFYIPDGTSGVIVADTSQEVKTPAGIVLTPGSTIKTVTTNIQTGDQYDAVNYHVRRRFAPGGTQTLV